MNLFWSLTGGLGAGLIVWALVEAFALHWGKEPRP